ncbi:MAG: methylated-DNA--[protein]-cysteine S-methyltransferase [Deltaproteobacteria bacterium]|nr:methylated-DNA--[protein]-cysteine S-methyltransferase [Deltaproteobacteria bacterium]
MHFFFTQARINSVYFTFLSATKGLYYISFSLKARDDVLTELQKRYGSAVILEENSEIHRPVITQIREYLAGRRRVFSMPTDVAGTAFQKMVWEAIRAIPYGETRSYQEIAKSIGKAKAARAVGQAAGANPLPLIIPCHRVIGSTGKLVGFSSGLNLKTKLLALENTYKEK